MVALTASLEHWLTENHCEIIPLLYFGHTELLTEEMWMEYMKWCKTDEARDYFPGGKYYHDPR